MPTLDGMTLQGPKKTLKRAAAQHIHHNGSVPMVLFYTLKARAAVVQPS
jgi:hypothetical protein